MCRAPPRPSARATNRVANSVEPTLQGRHWPHEPRALKAEYAAITWTGDIDPADVYFRTLTLETYNNGKWFYSATTFLDRIERQLEDLSIPDDLKQDAIRFEGLRRRPAMLQGESPQSQASRGWSPDRIRPEYKGFC